MIDTQLTDHVLRAGTSQLISDADIARLNSRLPLSVRFSVSGSPGSSQTAVATMALMHSGGNVSAASHRLALARTRRGALHSVADGFAECAMSLGLGTGVYGSGVPVPRCRIDGESP